MKMKMKIYTYEIEYEDKDLGITGKKTILNAVSETHAIELFRAKMAALFPIPHDIEILSAKILNAYEREWG